MILENQAALQQQLDELRRNSHEQRPYQLGATITPAPLDVARDIPQPNNDNSKVTASDVHALLETLGYCEAGARHNAYESLSQLAEKTVAELQVALDTPGECLHKWGDVPKGLRSEAYKDMDAAAAAEKGIPINRCINNWVSKFTISQKWGNRNRYMRCTQSLVSLALR